MVVFNRLSSTLLTNKIFDDALISSDFFTSVFFLCFLCEVPVLANWTEN